MEKEVIADRATELQTGGIPLQTSNVLLGLPDKPDPMLSQIDHAFPANWSLVEYLSQKKKVAVFNISTSTPEDTVLWNFRHTFPNVYNMHLRQQKDLFALWKWNLHFLFEFRSNYQQVGQILVVNHTMPQAYVKTVLPQFSKLSSEYYCMTQLPHQKVPMGEDVDVHAVLKWDANVECSFGAGAYSYVKANPVDYDMGEIFVVAPWQMQVAAGVNPSLTCVVWSWLTDLHMSGYSPSDNV